MELSTRPGDGHVVVTPSVDALEVTNAVDFKSQLVALAKTEPGHIIIDLEPVTFMDSSGLGAIVSCLKALGRRGELVLCGVQPGVQSLLELTRMNRVVRVFPDAAAAISGLAT